MNPAIEKNRRKLSHITYYLSVSVKEGVLPASQAVWLLEHPRSAKKWIYKDVGIRI